MKKILALVMAVAMMLSLAIAEAPVSVLEMKPEDVLKVSLETVESNHVLAWEGQWNLVAAYIGDCYIEEMELEDIEAGLYPVKPDALKMDVVAAYDKSANDPTTGPVVDQKEYIKAHTYDGVVTMNFAADICEEPGTIDIKWDRWNFIVDTTMENNGLFNYGPAECGPKCEDDFLFWNDIVGVDIGEEEEMNFIYLSTSGHLVLCYAEKKLTNEKYNWERVGYAYIFELVPAETPAE